MTLRQDGGRMTTGRSKAVTQASLVVHRRSSFVSRLAVSALSTPFDPHQSKIESPGNTHFVDKHLKNRFP
jgi:hypothetical protein